MPLQAFKDFVSAFHEMNFLMKTQPESVKHWASRDMRLAEILQSC